MDRTEVGKKDMREFPCVAILGPTGVGKTWFGIRLAQEIKGEIINFDSVQLYKYLDIGSAKPTPAERRQVPHHLLDILYPDEPFDAADFVARAGSLAMRILKRGRVPVFVGGTGFYLRALFHGLSPAPKASPALRRWLKTLEKRFGSGYLHRCLSRLDPPVANRLPPGDLYRIIRALEIFILTGGPMSDFFSRTPPRPVLTREVVKILLLRPRRELYERIDKRVDMMVSGGLIEEVRSILNMGYSPRLKPLQSLGYRQIVRYLNGELDLARAIHEIKRDTRHYAKRQLTWFKKERCFIPVNPDRLKGETRLWHAVMGNDILL